MPELPEVETVRRGLAPALEGRTITRVEQNRADLRIPFPDGFAQKLTGRRIIEIGRRAKYLLLHLDNSTIWLIHLGMSGRVLVDRATDAANKKHDHLVVFFDDGKRLVYHDARRFGLMTLLDAAESETHPLLSHLGPEPLAAGFDAAYLSGRMQGKKIDIKQCVMDQRVVVGVGNIYACEALHRARTSPFVPASHVAPDCGPLVEAIRVILQEAIASGGSTLRDYVRSSGDIGYFQHAFRVYGREGEACTTCKTPIERKVQGGRPTFFCIECQNVR